MKVSEILKALPTLDRADLEKLRDRVGFLLSKNVQLQAKKDGVAPPEDWILNGIVSELAAAKIIPPRSSRLKRLKGGAVYAQYKSNLPFVLEVLEPYVKDATTAERNALGCMFARALMLYLDWRDIQEDTLLLEISKMPAAIERQFPGYLKSGVILAVARMYDRGEARFASTGGDIGG